MKSLDTPNYRLTGSYNIPDNIEYESRVYAFINVITDATGRITTITYYAAFDSVTSTPSEPVVEERYTFSLNAIGFAQSRTKEVDFYLDDDTVGFTRVEPIKYYSFNSSKVEGNRRRENLINDATNLLITSVGLSNAIAFSSGKTIELYAYQFGNNTQLLKDAVTNAVEVYMTQPIKDAVLAILNNA